MPPAGIISQQTNNMRLLGIDYGEKRIGLALSDDKGMMAFPHSVINAKDAVSVIEKLAKEQGVTTIVVGDSKDYKGNANPIMLLAKPFSKELADRGFEVVFESELLSSHQASHFQGKTVMTDAAAASIILQSYIDRIKK
jgi:putative Holliday junction resolvase